MLEELENILPNHYKYLSKGPGNVHSSEYRLLQIWRLMERLEYQNKRTWEEKEEMAVLATKCPFWTSFQKLDIHSHPEIICLQLQPVYLRNDVRLYNMFCYNFEAAKTHYFWLPLKVLRRDSKTCQSFNWTIVAN